MGKKNPFLVMKQVCFKYGPKPVLKNFDLQIDSGRIYALLGTSGSGKTTTVQIMNGLLKPDSGVVFLDGKKFDYAKSVQCRRFMGYSMQRNGLFPHMSIRENISLIARKESWSQLKIQKRIQELCQLVNLPGDREFLQKKPRQISGGQQQRVDIARSLFMSPKIILMDEPFSALDPMTRSEIQQELCLLQKKLNLTIVIVTHDLPEAFAMAHEIILINKGQVEQKARPSHFLLRPETEYVEKFMKFHSPGNRLKEILLYSVVNSDIFTAFKNTEGNPHGQGTITLQNLDSLETTTFSNMDKAQKYLEEKGQNCFYWVTKKNLFLSTYVLGSGNSNHFCLQAKDDILEGMKQLLDHKTSSIPVVREGKLIGVFSQGALDAL